MILINLLPHREAARKARTAAYQRLALVSALAGLAVAALVYLWFQERIENQRGRNQFLQTQIAALDAQIKEIANIEQEIASLTARQQAVEDLQADRNLPVHLLNELVRQLPDGVYVSQLRQEGQAVTLRGVAQSNERISELLRNLSEQTPWLARPQLTEIVAGTQAIGPRENRRVANFNLSVQLVRSSEAAAAGAPARP